MAFWRLKGELEISNYYAFQFAFHYITLRVICQEKILNFVVNSKKTKAVQFDEIVNFLLIQQLLP
jgi:hypothetical protein